MGRQVSIMLYGRTLEVEFGTWWYNDAVRVIRNGFMFFMVSLEVAELKILSRCLVSLSHPTWIVVRWLVANMSARSK